MFFLENFGCVGHGYYIGIIGHFSNLFKLSKEQSSSFDLIILIYKSFQQFEASGEILNSGI